MGQVTAPFLIMVVNINGYDWEIVWTHCCEDLSRSDGSLTLGVTDTGLKTIFIHDKLNENMNQKVLIHELVHAWIFSYGIYIPLEQEEFICSFIDTYGIDIMNMADEVLCTGYCRSAR